MLNYYSGRQIFTIQADSDHIEARLQRVHIKQMYAGRAILQTLNFSSPGII